MPNRLKEEVLLLLLCLGHQRLPRELRPRLLSGEPDDVPNLLHVVLVFFPAPRTPQVQPEASWTASARAALL